MRSTLTGLSSDGAMRDAVTCSALSGMSDRASAAHTSCGVGVGLRVRARVRVRVRATGRLRVRATGRVGARARVRDGGEGGGLRLVLGAQAEQDAPATQRDQTSLCG